jgi:hypothetical protein
MESTGTVAQRLLLKCRDCQNAKGPRDRVVGYDGNEVRYAVYDLAHPSKLTERQHSQSWADFLADLESEIECPQPDRSNE